MATNDSHPTTDPDGQSRRQPIDSTDLPNYKCPYEPGSRVYQNVAAQGYYGVMYAGEYEWCNLRCTAEAYADTSVGRSKTIDGQPRRSLKFHTEWLTVDRAKACVGEIPRYNNFDSDDVKNALDELANLRVDVRIVVGREGSPVLYVYSTDGPAVYDVFNSMSRTVETPDELPAWVDDDVDGGTVYAGPNELGIVTEPETYPTRGIGEAASDVDSGVPTVVRAWWD